MLLTVLKYGGQWEFLARLFQKKGPTFEKFIDNFANLISDEVYRTCVVDLGKKYRMVDLQEKQTLFSAYPYARYATDVTFQQAYRPSGSLQEGKLYYSAKHKLYGFKVEVSVLPNGYALNCSSHNPGSTSDLRIFQEAQNFHKVELKKTREEREKEDDGELSTTQGRYWGVLMDKGYQGAAEFIRAIIPKKKPKNGTLSRSDTQRNERIASDRVLVENFFGQMCGLWNLMGGKWKWAEGDYDAYFKLCAGFTNMHINWHPLRTEDVDRFRRLRNRLDDIGASRIEKRRRVQERYRQRRRARVNLQFRAEQIHSVPRIGREDEH